MFFFLELGTLIGAQVLAVESKFYQLRIYTSWGYLRSSIINYIIEVIEKKISKQFSLFIFLCWSLNLFSDSSNGPEESLFKQFRIYKLMYIDACFYCHKMYN